MKQDKVLDKWVFKLYWLSEINLKEIESITFAEMNMKEKDIETLLRQNIEIITGEEDSLLIIGEQVKNKENARSDLTAIDQNGNIVH